MTMMFSALFSSVFNVAVTKSASGCTRSAPARLILESAHYVFAVSAACSRL